MTQITERQLRVREIAARIEGILPPVTFIVPVQGTLAVALYSYAMETGNMPETIIAEALRAYMGDAL